MAFMVHHLELEDFDTWKPFFDADPVGRKQAAKGPRHAPRRQPTLMRSSPRGVRLGRDAEVVPRPSHRFRRARPDDGADAAHGLELVENITY